jgi:FkbM family methyltransferase
MNRKQRRAATKLGRPLSNPPGPAAAAVAPTGAAELLAAGIKHHNAGRLAEAEACYQRVLGAQPDNADALHLVGILRIQGKQHDVAVEMISRAIKRNGRDPSYFCNLGVALKELGKLDEAVAAYRQAVRLKPDLAEAHSNLGVALKELGKLDEAVAAYRQAIGIKADYAEAHSNLGIALKAQGKLDEAVAAQRRAIGIKPDSAEVHSNLGDALKELGKLDEAVAACRRAISIKPDSAEARCGLGNGLNELGKLEEAVAAYRQAIRIKPDYAEAHYNLGNALSDQGKLDQAVAAYRQAIGIKPDYAVAHSNLLFCLNRDDKITPDRLFAAHREWDERYGWQAPRPSAYANDREAGRRLRIGYVSPDFRLHSVAFFLEPLLKAHDRQAVEVFCYAEITRPDTATANLRGLADHWLVTVGLSDDEFAQRIRADGIDILVDCAGHSGRNRLPVFARKPAPVQVTWLGYPNTTGLKAIDYRLVDAVTDPVGEADALASETLVRLESGFLCYGGLKGAPEPVAPPCLKTGTMTFGSFNNPTKVSAATFNAWATLLGRLPQGRLLLKGKQFTDSATRALFLARLGERGVVAERVELLAWVPDSAAHLAVYDRVDIALDPFPYNGTTTTCESLWMGVPVVTLRGDRHAGRVGASLLGQVGLTDLIANSVEEYVEIAFALAGNPRRLGELRRSLRSRLAASPLCDGRAFAHKIEATFRHLWRLWCEAPTSDMDSSNERTEIAGSHEMSALRLRVRDGLTIAVPPTLSAITTYVLLEQEDWFEKEIDFLRHFVKPGMIAIDIGANLGVYSLLLARLVGPSGRVFSYEPGREARALLEHSRDLNDFGNLEIMDTALSDSERQGHLAAAASSELRALAVAGTGEAVRITSLDIENISRQWPSPDFIKIDAEGEEEQIIAGGRAFFSTNSPLVMFEIKAVDKLNNRLPTIFPAIGYRLFRLLAGAPILVPYDATQPLDEYELNLFAAKRDRVSTLSKQGLLVETIPAWAPSDIDRENAIVFWRLQKFSSPAAVSIANGTSEDSDYQDGLAAYATWRSTNQPVATRCAALAFALQSLRSVCARAATPERASTLARVAWEWGARSESVVALRQLLQMLQARRTEPREPFWPASPRFDQITPGDRPADWFAAAAAEQFERTFGFSSLFDDASPMLPWLCSQTFASAEMERRRTLVAARAGQQPGVPERLRTAAPDHLNAGVWRAGLVPGTVLGL